MDEEWRDVNGWIGVYKVSNKGNVQSLKRNILTPLGNIRKIQPKMLNKVKDSHGYMQEN